MTIWMSISPSPDVTSYDSGFFEITWGAWFIVISYALFRNFVPVYILYSINTDKNASRMKSLPGVWMPYFLVLRIQNCRHISVTWLSVENRSNLWKKNRRSKGNCFSCFVSSTPQSLQWIEETMNQTMKKPLKKNSCSFARTSCDYKRMKWKDQGVTPTTKS